MPTVYQTADYLALPRPESTFVVDDLLPVGGAMLIYGDPKVGKSFAALQLCEAVTNGTEWFGFGTQQGHVLYVQLDTPRILWMERIENLNESGQRLGAGLWHADRESLNTWPFNILNPEHFQRLQEIVAQIQPSLVIIDTLKESHQAPENDNSEGQRVVAALVAATQPAALCLVHHSRKPADNRPNDLINGARGASYLAGRMDCILAFSHRSVSFTSRAAESGTLRLERRENGFWDTTVNETNAEDLMNQLLASPDLNQREAARILAQSTGLSEDACRSRLRRELRRRGSVGSTTPQGASCNPPPDDGQRLG